MSGFQLKRLSPDGIDGALDKAHHYRLLNEPKLAESICADVLDVAPHDQRAVIAMIMALSDQFGTGFRVTRVDVKDLLERIEGAYERAYYTGLVAERRALAGLKAQIPGDAVWHWLTAAMRSYEQAIELAPAGRVEAVLRWNTCARVFNENHIQRPVRDNVQLFD